MNVGMRHNDWTYGISCNLPELFNNGSSWRDTLKTYLNLPLTFLKNIPISASVIDSPSFSITTFKSFDVITAISSCSILSAVFIYVLCMFCMAAFVHSSNSCLQTKTKHDQYTRCNLVTCIIIQYNKTNRWDVIKSPLEEGVKPSNTWISTVIHILEYSQIYHFHDISL